MGELGEGGERLGSSLGAEQQTGLLLTITPISSLHLISCSLIFFKICTLFHFFLPQALL